MGLWCRLGHSHHAQSHLEVLDVDGRELANLQESRLPLLQLGLAEMEVAVGQVALPAEEAAVPAEFAGPSDMMEKKCESVIRELRMMDLCAEEMKFMIGDVYLPFNWIP